MSQPQALRGCIGRALALVLGGVFLVSFTIVGTLLIYTALFPLDQGTQQIQSIIRDISTTVYAFLQNMAAAATAMPQTLSGPAESYLLPPSPTRTPSSVPTPERPPAIAPDVPPLPTIVHDLPIPVGKARTSLNIRERASAESEILGIMSAGDDFIIVGASKDKKWYAILSPDRGYVWVSSNSEYVRQYTAYVTEEVHDDWQEGHEEFNKVSRPPTGIMSQSIDFNREGSLFIKNGSGYDSVAILTTVTDTPLCGVFLRTGDEYNLTGIPDGTYFLYFISGNDWQPGPQKFSDPIGSFRFEERFDYATEQEGDSIYTSAWEITLYGVVGGNAGTNYVKEEDFPLMP